jgi:hypothetical protein
VFQIRLPSAVKVTNVTIGIRSTPAGIEMRLRKIGIIRPKKTALTPCRANHTSVRSRSATLTSGSLAMIARVRSRPTSAPA